MNTWLASARGCRFAEGVVEMKVLTLGLLVFAVGAISVSILVAGALAYLSCSVAMGGL